MTTPRPYPPAPTRVARPLRRRTRPLLSVRAWTIGLALVVAAGCGGGTKEDIIAKARNVHTRAQLEKALGTPGDVAKLGPIERWTYKASNGEVVFVIIGDSVTMQVAGDRKK